MLGKRMGSLKKLAKKLKAMCGGDDHGGQSQYECLLLKDIDEQMSPTAPAPTPTPSGFFAIYVGVEEQRFVVPTNFLSHPLFKMLLEKSYNEYGFAQRNKLVVPCSVSTFKEVVIAVECCNRKFDLGKLVEELL